MAESDDQSFILDKPLERLEQKVHFEENGGHTPRINLSYWRLVKQEKMESTPPVLVWTT